MKSALYFLALGIVVSLSSCQSSQSTAVGRSYSPSVSYGPGGKIITREKVDEIIISDEIVVGSEEQVEVIDEPNETSALSFIVPPRSTAPSRWSTFQDVVLYRPFQILGELSTKQAATPAAVEAEVVVLDILFTIFLIAGLVLLAYEAYIFGLVTLGVAVVGFTFSAVDYGYFYSIFMWIVSFASMIGALILLAME